MSRGKGGRPGGALSGGLVACTKFEKACTVIDQHRRLEISRFRERSETCRPCSFGATGSGGRRQDGEVLPFPLSLTRFDPQSYRLRNLGQISLQCILKYKNERKREEKQILICKIVMQNERNAATRTSGPEQTCSENRTFDRAPSKRVPKIKARNMFPR